MTIPTEHSCTFPQCPSGQWTIDIKEDLALIQSKQDRHYDLLSKLGAIVAQIEELQRQNVKHDAEHNEMFNRIRVVEGDKVSKQDLVWGVATLGVIFAIIQVIIKLAV